MRGRSSKSEISKTKDNGDRFEYGAILDLMIDFDVYLQNGDVAIA